jgi:hypothetical protein
MLRVTIPRTTHVVHATPRKIKASDVKHAIKHAQNLCFNFENTPECRSAWELVEELTISLDRQMTAEFRKEPDRTELAKREYDV